LDVQTRFASSYFAKTTDLRITFDPVKSSGFRLGIMTLSSLHGVGNTGFEGAVFASPRARFDAQGRHTGYHLFVGYEVDSPHTKSGFWAGAGAGVLLVWDGTVDKSPIRKNAEGALGIEVNINGNARFLPIPGLSSTIELFKMGSPDNVKISRAPGVSAADVARTVLNTDDPRVLAGLRQAAAVAEQTSGLVDSAVEAAGTVSQLASVAALAAGLSLPAILAAAAISVPLVAGWQEGLSDGTVAGHHRQIYKNDSQTAYEALKLVNGYLQQNGPLSSAERHDMNAALAQIKSIGNKWNGSPQLNAFYQQLPANQRFPWAPPQLQKLTELASDKR
jgi:hypothetical protein